MVVAFGLALLAALPDALLALWLQAARPTACSTRPRRGSASRAVGLARLGGAAPGSCAPCSTRRAAPLPGQGRPSPSSRTWPACRRRSPPSPTRSGPSYLDRLAVLRDQVFVLDHMYMSVFSTVGLDPPPRRHRRPAGLDQPGADPARAVRPADRAHSSWRPAVEREAEERGAPPSRLARHLFATATTAPPGKEVRVTGIGRPPGQPSGARRGSAGTGRWPRPAGASAVWHTLAWAIFGAGYVGGRRVRRRRARRPAPATCCSCSPPAPACRPTSAPRSARSASCAGIWMDGSRRLAWLEDYAAALEADADVPVPDRLGDGITLRARLLRLPRARPAGARRTSASTLPAGAVVAVVGENGAGKTHPGQAAVQVLRADQRADPGRRRRPGPDAGRRVAGPAGRRVPGLLPLRAARPGTASASATCPALDDEAAGRAPRSAGPAPTTSWPSWPAASTPSSGRPGPTGVEVSFGQWQKLALARGLHARRPAACSCSTSRPPRSTPRPSTPCSSATPPAPATPGDDGRITILVSHRFSTVRMADLIVVLDGARVVEVGTHDDLMARGGQYAELYAIQAAAYR